MAYCWCAVTDVHIEPDDTAAILRVDEVDGKHLTLDQLVAAFPGHESLSRTLAFAGRSPDLIGAGCNQTHRAVHYSGTRPLTVIDLQVIHDEEAPTALAAAMWFQNPASGGSATYCNDDYTCYRTLLDNQIPWGAPGANYHGLHYEQAGFARWHSIDWARHYRTIDRNAWKMARDARRYGIQVRWLDAAALRRGLRNGQTSHAQCTKAFGGSHTDPGFGYPKTLLMQRVRHHHEDLRHIKPVA